MVLKKKNFADMVRDSLRYLSSNTDITFLSQGSVAKALVEASNLEISRLQDFVSSVFDNSFLSTASGIYLDLFGEMLGLPRIKDRKATVSIEDGAVRFYVDSGTLGSRLRDPNDASRGLIPDGTTITNPEGTVAFVVTRDVSFPLNARSVFVPVRASQSGESFNIGANLLTQHNLGSTDVKVTNDISITTGSDIESDTEYRFRLSKSMTSRFGANATAVQLAALSQPGVSSVHIVPFSRGAGTFDVLLIPQGNRVTQGTLEDTRRAVEQVVAFGINPRIKEPEYLKFKTIVQLKFKNGTPDGQRIGARRSAESAILQYLATISLGGELVINQIRASVLGSSQSIQDIKIIEVCIDGNPRTLRNIQLDRDELLIPDDTATDAIQVI